MNKVINRYPGRQRFMNIAGNDNGLYVNGLCLVAFFKNLHMRVLHALLTLLLCSYVHDSVWDVNNVADSRAVEAYRSSSRSVREVGSCQLPCQLRRYADPPFFLFCTTFT